MEVWHGRACAEEMVMGAWLGGEGCVGVEWKEETVRPVSSRQLAPHAQAKKIAFIFWSNMSVVMQRKTWKPKRRFCHLLLPTKTGMYTQLYSTYMYSFKSLNTHLAAD